MNTGRTATGAARVCVEDLDTGERFRFQLVPGPARRRQGQLDRVFLDTSLGRALAGRACGSVVHWQGPSGVRRFVIISISQQDGLNPDLPLHRSLDRMRPDP